MWLTALCLPPLWRKRYPKHLIIKRTRTLVYRCGTIRMPTNYVSLIHHLCWAINFVTKYDNICFVYNLMEKKMTLNHISRSVGNQRENHTFRSIFSSSSLISAYLHTFSQRFLSSEQQHTSMQASPALLQEHLWEWHFVLQRNVSSCSTDSGAGSRSCVVMMGDIPSSSNIHQYLLLLPRRVSNNIIVPHNDLVEYGELF